MFSCVSAVVTSLFCVSQIACGGSSNVPNATSNPNDVSINDALVQPIADSRPQVLQDIGLESDLLVGIPELVQYAVLADSGIQIAYTDAGQLERAAAQSIELQWQSIQDCLGQTAAAPLVLIRADEVEPFLSDDLVLFYFSAPVASATIRTGTVLQISDTDFDGSLGPVGFYLRSIMGRFLWTAANLDVSDYPHACAVQAETEF